MSECSSVKPYHIPPGNILRQKLKDRIQESNETPLSRKKCTSESVVLDTTLDAISHDASLVMDNPTDMFSCTQLNEDGVYDCSNGKGYLLRLDSELLNSYEYDLTNIGVSKPSIIFAIDQVISTDISISPKPLSPFNHTMDMGSNI